MFHELLSLFGRLTVIATNRRKAAQHPQKGREIAAANRLPGRSVPPFLSNQQMQGLCGFCTQVARACPYKGGQRPRPFLVGSPPSTQLLPFTRPHCLSPRGSDGRTTPRLLPSPITWLGGAPLPTSLATGFFSPSESDVVSAVAAFRTVSVKACSSLE